MTILHEPAAEAREVFIESIGIAFGEQEMRIDALSMEGRTGTLLSELLMDGFICYRKTELPALELAAASFEDLKSKTTISFSDVDAIIFACENIEEISTGLRDIYAQYRAWPRDVVEWLSAQGLARAYPYGLWLTGCGNLSAGLAMAKTLIAARSHHTVLICMVDINRAAKTPPGLLTGSAILSDAASCCIVTDRPGAGPRYRIDEIDLNADLKLAAIDPILQQMQYLLAFERGFRQARESAEARFGQPVSSFDHILAPNLRSKSLLVSAKLMRIGAEHLRKARYAAVGHAYGTDHLTGLLDLHSDVLARNGDSVLLFNPGVFCWNFSALRLFHGT